MSFTFKDDGKDSAFAFVIVKKKGTDQSPYKVIIYLPRYDPKDYSAANPYRELYTGSGNFRGELRRKAVSLHLYLNYSILL